MEKLNGENMVTPKQIEVGSFLVEHFLNSLAFYKVVSTSEKSVLLQRVLTKQVRFENAGGFTGYNYVIPTNQPYSSKTIRKIVKPSRNGKTFHVYGPIGKSPMTIYNPDKNYSEYYI